MFPVLWFCSCNICIDYQIAGFLLDVCNLLQATSTMTATQVLSLWCHAPRLRVLASDFFPSSPPILKSSFDPKLDREGFFLILLPEWRPGESFFCQHLLIIIYASKLSFWYTKRNQKKNMLMHFKYISQNITPWNEIDKIVKSACWQMNAFLSSQKNI